MGKRVEHMSRYTDIFINPKYLNPKRGGLVQIRVMMVRMVNPAPRATKTVQSVTGVIL